MSNQKQTKADAKATAEEEATEQAFLAKQAQPAAHERSHTGAVKKPKAQAATTGEGTIQPREGDPEFLPPNDPPFEESLPFPPPAPDAVSHEEKGADPEDPAPARELNIAPGSTPGEGPRPEEPEAPAPEGKTKKGDDQ